MSTSPPNISRRSTTRLAIRTLVAWNNGDGDRRYWSLRGPNMESSAIACRAEPAGCSRFMAVAYIAHHADAYGITTIKLDDPPPIGC